MVFYYSIFSAVIIDQATKLAIAHSIRQGDSISLLGGKLHLTHVVNTGAAFSILQGRSLLLAVVALAFLTLAALNVRKVLSMSPILQIGGGLAAGGAIGNLIDRLRVGGVVDFLDLGWWPVFNAADAAIAIGAVLLFIGVIRAPEKVDK